MAIFNNVEPLKMWVHKILPLVYDDSMSYYETLCKVVQKLNEVVSLSNEQTEYLNNWLTSTEESLTAWKTDTKDELEEKINTDLGAAIDRLETEFADELLDAEGMIYGTQNDVPVEEGSEYYENNADYFRGQSAESAQMSRNYADGGSPHPSPIYAFNNSKYFRERAEAWANGEIYGQDVTSQDEAYENNGKYYMERSQAWTNGKIYEQDVPSGDEAYENNAKYYMEQARAAALTFVPDPTLSEAGRPAEAKATGDAIVDVEDALSNKVNVMHNLVNYGYANQEKTANPDSSYSYETIGVKRVNTNIVLNLANAQTTILYIKISGNIHRSNNASSVRNWSEGFTLTSGHRYRASLKYVSGTVAGITEPYITMSVYKVGESSSIGDVVGTGVREFIADSDPINLALYIYKGTTFNNAVYQVILEDLTELYSHSIYPKITVTKRNAILNLIDAYMAHDTDTVYNTSVTWNYYVTKGQTYRNNKLQVCCSSFAQLIWGGISPDTFFNDPTNYDGDIIKAFTWGYEMPFTARRKAGGLAIRENGVITGYYGLHTGDTNKETYSYTTYYNAGSSENLYSQRFKTFMYAADIAAELAMLGYEIPIGEADVGDLIFYRSAPYTLNPASNNEFKQITHVAVVIGKTDGYFDVAESSGLMEGVGIYKTSIASDNPFLAARAAGMAQNIVMAARHPAMFGVSGNVPNKFVTIPSKV